jgi:hypothetical protein
MITFTIQKFLIHLHPLGATNRLGALGVQHCESSCMRVYNIFFAQDYFFQSPSQSPWLLVYAAQLTNLYATQSTSTSHRNNSGMHC